MERKGKPAALPSGRKAGSEKSVPLAVSIGKRIALIRGKLSQKAFARSIECHWNSVGQYERGERVPIASLVNRICALYGVSHEWLLTGRGTQHPPSATHSGRVRELPAAYEAQRVVEIPIRWPAQRENSIEGPGGDPREKNEWLALPEWFVMRDKGVSRASLFAVSIREEAMDPTLRIGDLAVVDGRDREISGSGIFLFQVDHAWLIRRVQLLPGKVLEFSGDHLRCRPFSIELPEKPRSGQEQEKVKFLGKVIFVCKRP